jgi:AraC-like DNA-binding protein
MRAPTGMACSADDDCRVVRFSTGDFAPSDRLDAWREAYGRALQRVDIQPLSTRFRTEAVLRRMPGLAVNLVRRSAVTHQRRREFVESDDIGMTIGLTSRFEANQFGRSLVLKPSEAVVLTGAEPAALTAPESGLYIHLRVPKRALSPLVAGLDAAYCRRIPARSTPLRLLTRYIRILDETEVFTARHLRRQVVAHIYDLMALAIGATQEAAELAANRGARAACLFAVKQDIADRLGEPGLSIGAVAARRGLIPRYVQRLFECEGTTFTAYLLEQRLACAYRALGDPRSAGRKISSIAFDSGFGDLSYFNRTFRRQYGIAPSELRAAEDPPE